MLAGIQHLRDASRRIKEVRIDDCGVVEFVSDEGMTKTHAARTFSTAVRYEDWRSLHKVFIKYVGG